VSKHIAIPEELFIDMTCVDGSKLTDEQWADALKRCVDFYNAKYSTEIDRERAFREYLRRDFGPD
jgi:hypothetical protein